MVILLLWGCVPRMDDNSLEAIEVDGVAFGDSPTDGPVEVAGELAANPGVGEGDWALTVDGAAWGFHSPSHLDVGALDGATVTASARLGEDLLPTLVVSDADGPVLVSASAGDGSSTFGREVWRRGDVIGRGVVQAEEDDVDVLFTDVVVTDDDGERRVLPGEPTQLHLDGVAWRFTVVAAWLGDSPPGMKCETPDHLSVELARTDDEPGPPMVRADGRFAPAGSCM